MLSVEELHPIDDIPLPPLNVSDPKQSDLNDSGQLNTGGKLSVCDGRLHLFSDSPIPFFETDKSMLCFRYWGGTQSSYFGGFYLRLIGLIQHIGSMGGGHYIAYCQHKRKVQAAGIFSDV